MNNLKIVLSVEELDKIISEYKETDVKVIWSEEKILMFKFYKYYLQQTKNGITYKEEISHNQMVSIILKKLFGKVTIGEVILSEVIFEKPNKFIFKVNR